MELVRICLDDSIVTSSNCIEDGHSGQGGESCIGNMSHSNGEGCEDIAPLIA